MLLYLTDRMLGQILVDLGDDARLDIDVKGASQIGKRLWRRHDHKRRHVSRPHYLLHYRSDSLRKPLLLNVMPIDRLDCTPPTRVQRFADASRPFATLLVCQRVVVLEHALGLEIWKFLVTLIAQEQRFASVAYKNECIVRDFQFAHFNTTEAIGSFLCCKLGIASG